MELFNIIKPDMVNDSESFEFYMNYMRFKLNIEIDSMFYLLDWPSVAQTLYDLDFNIASVYSDNQVMKRKQLFTTILGYYLYYYNQPAIISLFHIDNVEEYNLQQLVSLKKELRQRYVVNSDKYYIRILNESIIDYSKPFNTIDLGRVETDVVRIPSSQDFFNPDYNMVFFNKLHFPDPDIIAINREKMYLHSIGAFDEKKLVKIK